MGRRGVSREAIESAYDALVSAGLTPSVRTVREKLGDTGSLTTIAEHLRAIHVERQEGPGPNLPDPLVRKLVEGASGFWRDLSDAADRMIEESRQAAAAEVAAARVDRDAALDQATRAREELGARKATLDTLERHLAETASRLERAEAELATLQDDRDEARVRARAVAEERDALRRELATTRDEHAERMARREEEQVALHARVEALERSLDAARAARESERAELAARLVEREGRHAETATALARSEEREAASSKAAEERASSLHRALEERVAERNDAREEVETLRARLQAITEARDALEAERAAAARDRGTAALLERLLDDDRTGRVLALLESIDARVGGELRDP